ncbi:MAG: site-2 protease family protein [Ruminococcaceae bacterium]|nr:site-2 protease family protein [Oscillospiraceae bacterium]
MLQELLSGNFDPIGLVVSLISSLVVVFLTLPIHEWAHGFAATKLGDPTPRYQGRLTLNPFAHIDYIGALCIILFGVGWAKPVQINPRNFNNPKMGMAITAFAGPAANIVVATVSLLFANAVATFGAGIGVAALYIYMFFVSIAQINVFLAVFNFIPVPPFDGSRILFAVLPDKYYWRVMQHERILMFAVLIIIATDILDKPLAIVSGAILNAINNFASLPFMFF